MQFVLTEELKRDPLSKNRFTVEGMRRELDEFYGDMCSFTPEDPDIFVKLAGFTARASFLRSQIMRMPENRLMTNFRTKELDPFIDECDRQFRTWSRNFAVLTQEWEMSRGT